MNSEGLTVGAIYLPNFTKYQVHILYLELSKKGRKTFVDRLV